MPTLTNQDVLVVYIPDQRLNSETRIESLPAELIMLINRTGIPKILPGFRQGRLMGSAMIGKVIQLNRTCRETQTDFRICDLNRNLMEVFLVMKLDRILKLYETEPQAIRAFTKPSRGLVDQSPGDTVCQSCPGPFEFTEESSPPLSRLREIRWASLSAVSTSKTANKAVAA